MQRAVDSLPELSDSGHNIRGWNLSDSSSNAAQTHTSQPGLTRQYGTINLFANINDDRDILNRTIRPHERFPGLEFLQRDDVDNDVDAEVDDDVDDGRDLSFGMYGSRSSSERFIVSSSSSEHHFGTPEDDNNRRLSSKRKSMEASGSSSNVEDNETEFRHSTSAPHQTTNNLPEQVQARLGLTIGDSAPDSPQRSFRVRINNPVQSSPPLATDSLEVGPGVRNTEAEQFHSSSRRYSPLTRWYRDTRSGASTSSLGFTSEREEASVPAVSGNISEHPMFLPSYEVGSTSQAPVNWTTDPSERISEMVRRGIMTSPSVDNEVGPSERSYRSSMLMDRHLSSTVGLYATQVLAGLRQDRHREVSEQIRNILDVMRSGQGLRYEDVMLLEHAAGISDIQDRHRDMRLDVDNMSYEELLALEEQIGDVCTGLNTETINKKLKQRTYTGGGTVIRTDTQVEAEEPCCVCQEEYKDGDELGTLECGHEFHAECIKQWLMQKNICPVCKTTGLSKDES